MKNDDIFNRCELQDVIKILLNKNQEQKSSDIVEDTALCTLIERRVKRKLAQGKEQNHACVSI